MDRKDFLSTMAMLGGAALLPSSVMKAADMAAAPKRDTRRADPSKVVLISDIHICGEFKDGKPFKYPYNPTSLNLRIEEILALRPLPANVIVFGDVAWDYGLEEDYRYAAELLKPLEDAGIKVTLALGNHDRRAPFFKVFPEYAQTTQVAGRVVSIVEMPDVDIAVNIGGNNLRLGHVGTILHQEYLFISSVIHSLPPFCLSFLHHRYSL